MKLSKKRYSILLFAICLISASLSAQTFTEKVNDFDSFRRLGTSWGDYDQDGDLDLFLSGDDAHFRDTCLIFKNDNGTFTGINITTAGVEDSPNEWGDYDNDGDLDIVTMLQHGGERQTTILRNDGNDTFVEIDPGIVPINQGSLRWIDYDSDGDLDIFVTGGTDFPVLQFTGIYRNDGNDIFTLGSTGFVQLGASTADWGDYDNDGDPDLLITGKGPGGFFEVRTLVYRNDGNDIFTELNTGFPNVYAGEGRWGDFDQDGDLDILVTGNDSTAGNFFTFVYRNDGNDTFTDIHATIGGSGEGGAVSLGDCDNDGDLDALIMSVSTNTSYATAVFRYDGDSTFTDLEQMIDLFCCGDLAWGDYDNDNDLDFIASAYSKTRIFQNESTSPNSAPGAPSSLSASVNDSDVTLSWAAATDAQTQSSGLTYNIRIGTTSGGVDVLSPMANPATGLRQIAAFGNAYEATSKTIKNLPPGNYFWSVQAIDNSYAGSQFATESSFTVGEVSYVCGDANLDDLANITDAVYLIQYIFSGGPAPVPAAAGDVNCDFSANITDAVYLIAYVFSGGPAPCDPDNNGEPDC